MADWAVVVKYHQFGQHIWDFQKKANFDFAYKVSLICFLLKLEVADSLPSVVA